jgi:predicted secreted protein/endonuclease/exonuclease/phosphatase family metal-dependent hydrolase
MRKQNRLISLVVLCALAIFGPSVVRADTSQDVSVAVGGEFTVDLASNPSTGYAWVLAESLPSWLEQVEKTYTATNPGVIGGGGTDHWKFRATGAGSANLTFQYKRSWESTVAQTHVCHVTATAQGGTTSDGVDVTVLTYNTHLFEDTIVVPFSPADYHDDTTRRHRIADKVKASGADIVALDEVWAYSNQQWFANELKATYPYSAFFDSACPTLLGGLPDLGNGLVLLSKWELLDVHFERFPVFEFELEPGNSDCWANKGVLTATVDIGGRPLRVGITHAPLDSDDYKGQMSRHYVDITPFELNGQSYIFGLHVDVGANIFRIDNYGTSCSTEKGCLCGAGKELVLYGAAMSPNYLFVRSFQLNGHPYIFGLHDKGGNNAEMKLWRINDDPATGITLLDKAGGGPTSSKYVAMLTFQLNGHPYLFGLHQGSTNGEPKLWRINDDPATGMTLLDKAGGGPTSYNYVAMESFELNGHPYLFGLFGGGYANIWRINDDPATGMTIVKQNCPGGPTSADYVAMTTFQLNGHPYVFGLHDHSEATIWRINDDPSTGMNKIVDRAPWDYNYRFVKSIMLNGHPYLFGLKNCCDDDIDPCGRWRPGEAYITRINDEVRPGEGWQDALQMENIKIIANKTIIKDGPPAVMMGDLNVHTSRYGIMNAIFEQAGAVDAYASAHAAGADGNTVDLGKNKLFQVLSPKDPNGPHTEGSWDRIDYVYVKETGNGYRLVPTEVRVIRDWTYNDTNDLIPDRDLSDHYPVLAKFQLRPEGKSLVLYLPFDEGAGAAAKDISTYCSPGTVAGATWVPGIRGTALEFVNGSHVTIPEIPQYDVTSAMSVLAWVKATTSPNWGRVIDKSEYQTSGFDMCLTYAAGLPRFEFFVNNTTSSVDGTTVLKDGRWHFIVGTFGNKTLRIYVDGKKEAEAQSTGNMNINPNNWPLMIGNIASPNGAQQYLGSIDEVAMYNRELSADEVMSIFQNGIRVEK